MLTVITDDLVIDMEQVLYLSKDAHPYTLRFRGGAELELTLAEGQAVIAKLKEANKPTDNPFMPQYSSSDDIHVTVTNTKADGATITDTSCDNEDEIDSDEYRYAVESCGVPVEAKTQHPSQTSDLDTFPEGRVFAKDCRPGTFYHSEQGTKLLCIRHDEDLWNAEFIARDKENESNIRRDFGPYHQMRVAHVQSW